MVGDGEVVLDFVELVVVDDGDGVLLGVVGALVQGLVELGEGQGLGIGAQGGHGGHDDGVLRGADEHALHVVGGLDGALVVGHAAEAVAVVGQHPHVEVQQTGLGLGLHLAVHEGPGLLEVSELEGQGGDAHLGVVGGEVGGVGDDDVHGAGVQRHGVDEVGVAAQLAGGVDLSGQSAAGLLGDLVSELLGGNGAGVLLVGGDADLQGEGGVGGGGAAGLGGSGALGGGGGGAVAAAGGQSEHQSGGQEHGGESLLHDSTSFHSNDFIVYVHTSQQDQMTPLRSRAFFSSAAPNRGLPRKGFP